VLGARRMPDGVPPVLIVDAYDRLDRSLLPWEDMPVLGDLRRMDHLSRLNPFDGAARHGRALIGTEWFFDAIDDDVLAEVDLSEYRAVVWIAGEESTTDESFSDAQQAIIQTYWEGGGTLVVSGAEILWDLDYLGSESDRAFAATVLGVGMAEDDAGVHSAMGIDLLDGLPLDFAESAGSPYPVEYPDVLTPADGRTVIADYGSGMPAGALGEGVAHFGFPLETIGDDGVRGQLLDAVLWELVPDWDAPEVDPGDTGDTGEPGEDTDPPDDDTGTDGLGPPSDGPGDKVDLDKGGCACTQADPPGSLLAVFGGLLALVGIRRRD